MMTEEDFERAEREEPDLVAFCKSVAPWPELWRRVYEGSLGEIRVSPETVEAFEELRK